MCYLKKMEMCRFQHKKICFKKVGLSFLNFVRFKILFQKHLSPILSSHLVLSEMSVIFAKYCISLLVTILLLLSRFKACQSNQRK